MDSKNNKHFSVDSVGEEANVKIVTDLLGTGEISKSISTAYSKTIENLGPGAKMFIISMIIALAAIILIPFLNIKAFSSYRFDWILTVWFIIFFIMGSLYFWIDCLKKKDC